MIKLNIFKHKLLLPIVSLLILGLHYPTNINASESSSQYPIEYPWQMELYQQQKKNIYHYFLLMPSAFIDAEMAGLGYFDTKDKREERVKIQTLDINNGYIEYNHGSQLVLFKTSAGKDILGVQSGRCARGVNFHFIDSFFQLTNGKWVERTDLIPQEIRLKEIELYNLGDDSMCPYLSMPRYGKQVELINAVDGKVLDRFQPKI